MSDNDQALTVEILGDATSAVEATQVSQASLDKLTAAIGELTASFISQNTASETATAGVAKVGVAAATSSRELTELSTVGGSAARAFSALGIAGGEAAGRVEALTGALGGMGAVAPEILAVGAAIGSLFVALEFLKNGIKSAIDFQSQMLTMKEAIEAQGGAWSGLSQQIQAFVATESMASGFTKNELAASLNILITSLSGLEGANAAVSDSEKILAVAEETAIAKHKDLSEVVRALQSAEVGRGLALAQLDPRIKTLIKDHADLDTVLRVLHEDNQKQLSDTQGTQMATERLHAAYDGLGQTIGNYFLPILSKVAAVAIGSIPALGDLARALVDGLGGALGIVAHGAATAYHGLLAIATLGVGDLKDAKDEFKAFTDQGKDMGKSLYGATVGWMGDGAKAAGDFATAYGRAQSQIASSIQKHISLVKDLHTTFDPTLGNTPTSGSGAGAVAGPSAFTQDAVQRTQDQTAASNALRTATDALSEAKNRAALIENALENAVKLSTTTTEKSAAQARLDAQVVADAAAQHKILNDAVYSEQQRLDQLTGAQASARTQYEALNKQLQDHQKSLEGAKKESLATKESTAQLAAAVSDAKAKYEDINRAVSTLSSGLKTQQDELTRTAIASRNAAQKQAEDLAATQLAFNDAMSKEERAEQESAAKRSMTTRQLIEYDKQQYAEDYQNYLYYSQQKDAATAKLFGDKVIQDLRDLNQDKNALYQQDYNNLKQWADRAGQMFGTFFDSLVTGGHTLRDMWKQVWQQILQDFSQMLSEMVAKMVTSGLLNMLSGLFGGGGGLGSVANGVVGLGVGTMGGAAARGGSSLGGGGGAGAAGPSVAGAMASARSGAMASNTGGGSAGGWGGNVSQGTGSGSLGGWGSNLGQGVGSSSSSYGGGFGTSSLGGGAGAASLLTRGGGFGALGGIPLAGLAGAGIIGSMLGNLIAPHNTNAMMGGAAGGAAGFAGMEMLMANPAFLAALGPYAIPALIGATLLGAVFGSEIGHLFGNHFNAADEPDINQTQAWGQELADLQGSTAGNPMNANGQAFTMDSNTNSQTQGKGWNVLLESFVQKFRGKQKTLPQSLQAGFSDIEALWGGATNSPDFNGNGKNGQLQIGSGRTAEWTTFWQYVSAYGPAIAQLMNMYTATDLYSASLNGSVSSMGGYTPSGDPFLLHSFPDSGLPGGSGGMPPSVQGNIGGSKQTVVNVNNYQMFGGSSIADGNIRRSIAQNVADAIRQGFNLYQLNTI